MATRGGLLIAGIITACCAFDVQAAGSEAAAVSSLDSAWLATLPLTDSVPTETLDAAPSADDTIPAPAPSRDRPFFDRDPDRYSVVSTAKGISFHKPIYLYPGTYSGRYPGRESEVLFGLSLKLRVFKLPFYLAYSQKSFFQAFNGKDSKPFRETDFNPEAFYRFLPRDPKPWFHLGLDAGIEHESNGQSLPGSRSWNRVYIAPFRAAGKSLIYWKWWFRLPENKDLPRTDPRRDDNPDIQDYYGYSELHIEQELFRGHVINGLFRLNPATGRGAVNLQYTIPGPYDNFFWSFYVWNGYGESLLDYNRSVTRVGLGISIVR